jgi:hypothetical protein
MNDKIKEELQQILDQTHVHEKKREIKETKNSYQFSCPVCGDSTKDVSRKRAHILFDKANPYFYCHHECGGMSMEKFYSHFNMKWVEEEDFGFFTTPIKSTPKLKYDVREESLREIGRLAVPVDLLIEGFGMTRIDENHAEWQYLVSRNLQQYKDYFLYWPKNHRLVILNTIDEPELEQRWNKDGYYTVSSCRVIGFQARGLGNHKLKYITYTLEKLRGELGLEYKVKRGCEDNVKLLSQVFYSTHIDWTQDVLITEGPLDALFLDNSISLTGATKSISKLDQNYLCQYIFDNDNTGKEKQFEKVKKFQKQGYNWVGLCKQIGCDTVKDINDVVNHCVNTNQPIPKFKEYLI